MPFNSDVEVRCGRLLDEFRIARFIGYLRTRIVVAQFGAAIRHIVSATRRRKSRTCANTPRKRREIRRRHINLLARHVSYKNQAARIVSTDSYHLSWFQTGKLSQTSCFVLSFRLFTSVKNVSFDHFTTTIYY